MQTRQKFVDAYHEAMRTEQQLWEQIKGRGPGQPGHDRALWQQWLEAVNRTTYAAKVLREAFTSSVMSSMRGSADSASSNPD